MQKILVVISLGLVACGRTDLPWEEKAEPVTPVQPRREPSNPEPCRVELPDDRYVRFDFPQQRCRFSLAEAAQGITFRYGVEVIASEPDMVESVSLPGQYCVEPMSGPNIYIKEQVSGGTQRYCDCDRGLCTRSPMVIGAHLGRFEGVLAWGGRNWNGLSDTGNPKGAPFPPGDYVFSLEALLGDARIDAEPNLVTAKLYFTLTP